MFGFKIISDEEYRDLQRLRIKEQKFWQVHRWFSGWRDLDIIWTYLVDDVNFGGIERARKDYAFVRKTNEYGTPIETSLDGADYEAGAK